MSRPRAVAWAAILAAGTVLPLAAGCGQVSATDAGPQAGVGTQTTTGSPTTAKRSTAPTPRPSVQPATAMTSPTRATAISAPTRQGPAFVVTRFHHRQVYDGNVYFAPPPAGVRPAVTGARAFALARRYWPDPHGTATPVVALAVYTNDGQGTMLPGGGLRRFDVRRLTWVVIDYGVDCSPVGPPAQLSGSPYPVEHSYHDCLFLTFVDATTGADRSMTDEGGPAVRDLSTG